MGVINSYFILKKKDCLSKNISIFVIIHFSLSSSIPKEAISFNPAFLVYYIM